MFLQVLHIYLYSIFKLIFSPPNNLTTFASSFPTCRNFLRCLLLYCFAGGLFLCRLLLGRFLLGLRESPSRDSE